MWKKYGGAALHAAFILLAAILLLTTLPRREDDRTRTESLTFLGKYSLGGSLWRTLEADDRPSALFGELKLRGRLERDLAAGEMLHLYLDHVSYTLRINGVQVASGGPDECGSRWVAIDCGALTAEDLLELTVQGNHCCSNADAYCRLLDNMYAGAAGEIPASLASQTVLRRVAGSLVGITAAAVLGVALACTLLRVPIAGDLWTLGLMALCMGGHITLSAVDAGMHFSLQIFVNCGQYLCLIVAVAELYRYLARKLSCGKTAAWAMACLDGAASSAVLLWALWRAQPLCLFIHWWALAQPLAALVLLGCCGVSLRQKKGRSMELWGAAILLVCLLVELGGTLLATYPADILGESVFVALFLLMLGKGCRFVAFDYQLAGQTRRMKSELENNRVMMAINQIRTHFIFNVLNAISGMCKYDPEKADRTIVRFARYLRVNIDVMGNDELVTFDAALQHVEDYVALEQIRFGEKLHFITDITEEEFMIPPLILQPLVENAIKHGITPRLGGGTVVLRTRYERGCILVQIEDDGVGFDVEKPLDDHSVGLRNVRFRLQHMIGGTLRVESTPGRGTVCTISIPEKGAMACM